ncbi:hypothetical protein ACIA5C_33515 [Actinoplanes sp. NPDC051343]|uniref:hypothetical protein n=1 Tax=Actinoplanes sp. NPDC051343 TaxID=3363906 RepID=UPI00379FB4E3
MAGPAGWLLRRRLFTIGVAVAVAVAGASAALADHKTGWTVVFAVVAVVVGSFGPTVIDRWAAHEEKQRRRAELKRDVEVRRTGSASWLLHPDRHVVPFFGRARALAELEAWATDPGSPVVRLVTGAGGVGKTRLAQHFTDRLAGWEVTSAHLDDEEKIVEHVTAGNRGHRRLVLVDYAEARNPVGLARLLWVAHETGGVKVLCLARHAGEWWTTLSKSFLAQGSLLDQLTEPSNVLELAPQVGDQSPGQVVADAVAAFADRLGRPVVKVPDRTRDPQAPVLQLHAEALVLVMDGGYRKGRHDVLSEVLRHEARYWRGAASRAHLPSVEDPHSDAVLRQLVGLATLLGADDSGQVKALVKRAPLLSDADADATRRYASWLGDLYPLDPEGGGGLGVVQPDLLAEALAVRVLEECEPAERTQVFTVLRPEQAVRALTVLGRACAHQPAADDLIGIALRADVPQMIAAVVQVAVQFPGRFTRRMAELVDSADLDWYQACELAGRISHPTVELGRLATALTTRIVEHFPSAAPPSIRAFWASSNAIRLNDVGRGADALVAGQKAVDLYQELAATNADEFLPLLARAVNNHASRLAEADQEEEALRFSQYSVDLRRKLVVSDQFTYLPDLANAVINHALRLARAVREPEALDFSQEAVGLYRKLVTPNCDKYRPELAMALNNHALRLATAGRPNAVATIRDAVGLGRELVGKNRDAHLPVLAASLCNVGSVGFEVGDVDDEVIALTAEGLRYFEELARAEPGAYARRRDQAASVLTELHDSVA